MTRLSTTLALFPLTAVITLAACSTDMPRVDDPPPTADAALTPVADPSAEPAAPPVAKEATFDHSAWTTLLHKYVNDEGRVRYSAWKADGESMTALDAYLGQIASADAKALPDKARLAFYINAYNAYCAKAVLDRYPLKSVMDVKGFFDAKKFKVAGEELTLNDLETNRIREDFGEPRIHFVVNCASGSCPRIARDALTATNLDGLMEAGARAYIQKETTVKGKTLVTSKIFEWFKADFEKSSGSVNDFLAKYVEPGQKEAVKSAKVTTRKYDWSLNEAK